MADKKKDTATKKASKKDATPKATLPPSGFRVAVREILRSKSALTALIIIILILVNGIFSMSEIAVISARKSSLSTDVKKGSKAADNRV